MSQDSPTPFHFTAHVLHWRLLPVWVKHVSLHNIQAIHQTDLINVPHIQSRRWPCQSSIATTSFIYGWNYDSVRSYHKVEVKMPENRNRLHLLFGSRGVLSSFFRRPLLTDRQKNFTMKKIKSTLFFHNTHDIQIEAEMIRSQENNCLVFHMHTLTLVKVQLLLIRHTCKPV